MQWPSLNAIDAGPSHGSIWALMNSYIERRSALMWRWFCHASGTIIITASGNS